MTYVISDIHGCYDKLRDMLRKINFSESDTLYVLGDVVDRGADGMKVILDLAARKNVITLKGNHDHTAFMLLKNLAVPSDDPRADEFAEVFRLWLSDGGIPTYEGYSKLCVSEKERCCHSCTLCRFIKKRRYAAGSILCRTPCPKRLKCLIWTYAAPRILLWVSPNMRKHTLMTE